MGREYWDDFQVGEKFLAPGITITEAHLLAWSGLTQDCYGLHMDEEFAKNTIFGSRIAHGPLIFALSMGLGTGAGFYGCSIICWLGVENMRLPLPVRIGDTIRTHIEVKELRESGRSDRGIGVFAHEVMNQRGENVMSYDVLHLMHRKAVA